MHAYVSAYVHVRTCILCQVPNFKQGGLPCLRYSRAQKQWDVYVCMYVCMYVFCACGFTGIFTPSLPPCLILTPRGNTDILLYVRTHVMAPTEGSLVDKNMLKEGERSMSWSPREISTRPPVRRTSLFSTGLRMGS